MRLKSNEAIKKIGEGLSVAGSGANQLYDRGFDRLATHMKRGARNRYHDKKEIALEQGASKRDIDRLRGNYKMSKSGVNMARDIAKSKPTKFLLGAGAVGSVLMSGD